MSKDLFGDVVAMHRKFGFPVREMPGFIDDEHQLMRMNFLLEELLETAKACGMSLHATVDGDTHQVEFKFEMSEEPVRNLEEALDGLHDLVYVALGTSDLMGMAHRVEKEGLGYGDSIHAETWDRVHYANMSKVRVKRAGESTRGAKFDLRKPEGWVKPQYKDVHPAFQGE